MGGVPLAVAVPRVPAAGKKKKKKGKIVADESLFFSTLWLGGGGAAAPVPLQTEVSPLPNSDVSPGAPLAAAAATQGLWAQAAGPAPCLAPRCRQLRHHAAVWDANLSAESLGSLGTRGASQAAPCPAPRTASALGEGPQRTRRGPPGCCPCRGGLGGPELAVLTGDELRDLAQSPFHASHVLLVARLRHARRHRTVAAGEGLRPQGLPPGRAAPAPALCRSTQEATKGPFAPRLAARTVPGEEKAPLCLRPWAATGPGTGRAAPGGCAPCAGGGRGQTARVAVPCTSPGGGPTKAPFAPVLLGLFGGSRGWLRAAGPPQ